MSLKKSLKSKVKVNQIPVKPYMTVKELAKETGLSEYYIRKLIAQNKIPYLEAGRKFLIEYEFFMNFLRQESRKKIKECD